MKILYGINGTGIGHISKSNTIIKEILKLGIKVDVLLSGNNYNIDLPFLVKYRFKGISFIYTKNGSIDYIKSFKQSYFLDTIKNFNLDLSEYDLIISDFEPITAWSSKLQKRKCIGIGHQYSFLSYKSPRDNYSVLSEFILKWFAPVKDYIGLHFEKYDNKILHPVIRTDITDSKNINMGYYLVYLPSYSLDYLISLLSDKKQKFEIYTKEVSEIVIIKNLIIKPSDIKTFSDSLLKCKGVITSSGFETPSEALYLNKELMCIPIKGQYEQICNAESLKKLGVFCTNDIKDIDLFLSKNNKIKYNWENPLPIILDFILLNMK